MWAKKTWIFLYLGIPIIEELRDLDYNMLPPSHIHVERRVLRKDYCLART